MDWPIVSFAMLAAALAGRTLFTALATAAGIFALLFAAASAFFGRRFLRGLRRRATAPSLPPVTVIKPLKGADGPLYENLASFFRQEYPCFQLVFCLQSPDDPALGVVTRLKREFPDADMEVVVSKNRIGFNPKVNNMANGYAFAKYDLLLLSDSDVHARPDFLRRMVVPFEDTGVGLVTAFYEATGSRGLWGHMEALSVNASFLPQALCAAAFGMRFAMGAAMMVRRAAFESAGGFYNLADHLADDFWLGESIREAGWNLELSDAVVETVPDIDDGAEHFKHLVRWARTIRICQPAGYAASLIQHGFSLLTLEVILFGADRRALALMLGIWAAKAAASAFLGDALGGRQPVRALLLLPLAEWFSFAAWIAGCGSSRVLWRGELYEVQSQGRLVPVAVPTPALRRRPAAVEP
ncbi:MAG TPA: bacteriohopanetetrol glucosamine biosynthesis glycosyltransferase HpnI [Elusimicrobiota bacterium]|jgi:ceramide glucosyltransferase|nr:bacteriohopanetetrol glucosamine biosynthesis glycosyltransferase HpnI [Elusimicrobiota bacterium]